MAESVEITKIFEILSQPIRMHIVKQLNVQQRQFSQILDCFDGLKSNKLSFHLKKLINAEVITKKEDYYQLTEFGYQALHFVEAFETGQLKEYKSDLLIDKDEVEGPTKSILRSDQVNVIDFQITKGLPVEVQTFDLFLGKNANYLNDKYFLPLPAPIDPEENPKTWLREFKKPLIQLMDDPKSQEWLKDRFLKYAYGTRGLYDYGLMDSSLAVPPIDTTISNIKDLLMQRGKTGLFAETGMGKSRILLYIASWWFREFGSPVLFIDNPSEMDDSDWKKLTEGLTDLIKTNKFESPLLLIIEDIQLVKKEELSSLRRLITKSSRSSWSIIVSYTISNIEYFNQIGLVQNKLIENIKRDLQPLEISEYLDLSQQWEVWRPFFIEWIQWVALDILVGEIPWNNPAINKRSVQFESPWSLVVSIGFLKSALSILQKTVTDNSFPLVLYSMLAYLYLFRGEQPIERSNLFNFLNLYSDEIKEIYSTDWEEKIAILIDEWASPYIRLLPPLKYIQKKGKLKKELLISFYHQKWAKEVAKLINDKEFSHVKELTHGFFRNSLPSLLYLWELITGHTNDTIDFVSWICENCRFELNRKGQLLLVYLKINESHFEKLPENVTLQAKQYTKLKDYQLLNWSFIKSVLINYRKFS